MDTLGIGLFLLIIMLLFLSGGIWIAMTLAICGWVEQMPHGSLRPYPCLSGWVRFCSEPS
jgi:hypothetical protein